MGTMTDRFQATISKRSIIFGAVVLWAGVLALSFCSGRPNLMPADLFPQNAGYTFFQFLFEVGLYGLGTAVIFVVPGLPLAFVFLDREDGAGVLAFYSFILSLTILIFGVSIYKLFVPAGLDTPSFFVVTLIASSSTLLMLALHKEEKTVVLPVRRDFCIVLALLVLSGIFSFWAQYGKIVAVGDNVNISPEYVSSLPLGQLNDVTEHYGLVESLKTKLLPYGHLEYVDRYGYSMIDPPAQKFVSLFLHLPFGPSFAVDGLNFLVLTVVTLLLSWQMAAEDFSRGPWLRWGLALPVILASYFFVVLADREFSVPLCDTTGLLCLFTMCQMYFLTKGKDGLFLCSAFFAFLTKYESLFFTLLILIFYARLFKPDAKKMRQLGSGVALAVLPYLFLVVTIGLMTGDLPVYVESFTLERFMRLDYFGILRRFYPGPSATFPSFTWEAVWRFSRQFMASTILLGLFLFYPYKKNKTAFLVQCTAVVYFVLIMVSKYKRIQYVSPLVFFSIAVTFRIILDRWHSKKRFLPETSS